MQRFKKILFVANSSAHDEAALAKTVRLARANKAALTVVSVQREAERSLPDLREVFHQYQEKRLEKLTRAVDADGVRLKTKALTGIAFLEVIREVVAGKYDLLMKPAEGRGGLGRWLFGSTDWNLMRKCPCPVWIIKASKRRKYSRILAAVDATPGDKANDDLNRLILGHATSLASSEQSQLHIVYVWCIPNEKILRSGRTRMTATQVDRYVRETKAARKTWLSELVAKYDLAQISNKVHLLKGDPASVISGLTKKTRAELVVMGTVARTGIPGFLIGNTAERILHELDCSVLTVKPRGFATPIRPHKKKTIKTAPTRNKAI